MVNGENADANMNIRIQENNINAYNIFKRTVDIIGALVGIIFLCPILNIFSN